MMFSLLVKTLRVRAGVSAFAVILKSIIIVIELVTSLSRNVGKVEKCIRFCV